LPVVSPGGLFPPTIPLRTGSHGGGWYLRDSKEYYCHERVRTASGLDDQIM
jgi:hypothetical protein